MRKLYLLLISFVLLFQLNAQVKNGYGGYRGIAGSGIIHKGSSQFDIGSFMLSDIKITSLNYSWLFKTNEKLNLSYTYQAAYLVNIIEIDKVFYNPKTSDIYVFDTKRAPTYMNFGFGVQKALAKNAFIGISSTYGISASLLQYYVINNEYVLNPDEEHPIYAPIIDDDGDILRNTVRFISSEEHGGSEPFGVHFTFTYNFLSSLYVGYAIPINPDSPSRQVSFYGKAAINHYYYRFKMYGNHEFPVSIALGLQL